MNKEICFALSEMAAFGDLIASLNRNGVPYEITSKDEGGIYIKIGKGF